MFGGAGLYRDDRMFGLVADGVIYLKTDAETVDRFRKAACRPFVYSRDGVAATMSYWSAPDAALDDPDEMKLWAELAWEAALRKAPPRKTKRRSSTKARKR